MKKAILVLVVIAVSISVIIVVINRPGKKTAIVVSSEQSLSTSEQPKEPEAKNLLCEETKNLPELAREELFGEFSIPESLKAELAQAQRTNNISNEWGEGGISQEELDKTGIAPAQFSQPALDEKVKNIIAGFSVPEKTFVKNLSNCLPDEAASEQAKTLNSEALASLGFSALTEQNYAQAEKAFTALIRNYPDAKAAPIATLELARIISSQGRVQEAQNMVDKAILQYGNDKEYMVIVQGLREEMNADE